MDPAYETDLWKRWKESGDEAARETIILEYMKIVHYVAGRMAVHVPQSVALDDLQGWGVLGLLDAVDKYDYTQDIKFSTYASIRVRGAILDQIRALDWAPRSLRTMARKVGSARDKLRHEHGREPSHEEIADSIGATAEQVEDTLAQVQTVHMLNLDDFLPAEDRAEARRIDMISDGSAPSPEEAAEHKEKEDLIIQAILELSEQQQKVLHLYYYQELTLKEIGAVLQVTESRVCQIHSAAVKKLRKVVRGEM